MGSMRVPRADVDELRAAIKRTAGVNPRIARAHTFILDLWATSHLVLEERDPPSLRHWSGGRDSALTDVINALSDAYGLDDRDDKRGPLRRFLSADTEPPGDVSAVVSVQRPDAPFCYLARQGEGWTMRPAADLNMTDPDATVFPWDRSGFMGLGDEFEEVRS